MLRRKLGAVISVLNPRVCQARETENKKTCFIMGASLQWLKKLHKSKMGQWRGGMGNNDYMIGAVLGEPHLRRGDV